VLVASAATQQVYYLLDYAGIRPAVPQAVALATAWATGYPRWSLLVAVWFTAAPVLFRTLVESEPLRQVLDDSVPDVVLFWGRAAARRGGAEPPRPGSGAGELRTAAPQCPPGLDRESAQIDRGDDRRCVP
jgi:hypothetical protein